MLVRVRGSEGLQLIAVESIVRVITPDDPKQGVKVALVNGATIALDEKEGRRMLAFLDGDIMELPVLDENGHLVQAASHRRQPGSGGFDKRPNVEPRPTEAPGNEAERTDLRTEQRAAALSEATTKAPETAAPADRAA